MKTTQRKRNKKLINILDRLAVFGDITLEDEENNLIISQTLLKLPPNVREKVLNEVLFIHTTADGVVHRIFVTGKAEKTPPHLKKIIPPDLVQLQQITIILNFRGIKDPSEKMDTVAHEIAHFKLGHDDTCGGSEVEKAADDLAEKWGFNRSYKSYK